MLLMESSLSNQKSFIISVFFFLFDVTEKIKPFSVIYCNLDFCKICDFNLFFSVTYKNVAQTVLFHNKNIQKTSLTTCCSSLEIK